MNEELATRRRVLHGMVATGCGIMLMTTFSACDSKKPETTSGPAPETPPPTPASAPSAAPAAPSASKAPQKSVQYQLQPKGDQKCANCAHFIAESTACKLVEGTISADAWCVLWTKAA